MERMGLMNRYPAVRNRAPKKKVRCTLLPRIFSAQRTSFRPRTMLMRAEAPAPTSDPNAWMMFMMGRVMAKAARIKGPFSACPRNMLSTRLYTVAIICVTTAGKAYFHNRERIFLVPSSLVVSIASVLMKDSV